MCTRPYSKHFSNLNPFLAYEVLMLLLLLLLSHFSRV